MRYRCEKPGHLSYKDYGARNIRVCRSWSQSFVAFYSDMGPRPGAGYSIERVDVNKGYAPENCKWATTKEQSNNKRTTVIVEFGGLSMSVREWASRQGIKHSVLYRRLREGWSVERALQQKARRLPGLDDS